jgi:hypothetical protein
MIEDIEPKWYFQRLSGGWRFFMGRTEGQSDGIKHWCINIDTPWFAFGRGY